MATGESVKREEREMLPRRWEPFRLVDEMERLFTEPFYTRSRMPAPFPRFSLMLQSPLAPRVDLYERDGLLVAKVELPGMKKEEIEVELEGGDLVIKGEHRVEEDVHKEVYYRLERSYGTFFRRIPLPVEVKPEEIEATYTDGILEVRIPVPATDKPRAKKVKIV